VATHRAVRAVRAGPHRLSAVQHSAQGCSGSTPISTATSSEDAAGHAPRLAAAVVPKPATVPSTTGGAAAAPPRSTLGPTAPLIEIEYERSVPLPSSATTSCRPLAVSMIPMDPRTTGWGCSAPGASGSTGWRHFRHGAGSEPASSSVASGSSSSITTLRSPSIVSLRACPRQSELSASAACVSARVYGRPAM
jgi:hypothetical protein